MLLCHLLLLFELQDFLLLSLLLILDFNVVRNSCSERLIWKAGLINDRNCHVSSKAGNGSKPHARFTDYLRDVNMLETIQDIILSISRCILFTFWTILRSLSLSGIKWKGSVSDWGFLVGQYLLKHLLVSGVDKLNDFWLLHFYMILIASIIVDFLDLVNKFANVDSSCTSSFFQNVGKLVQIIAQVSRFSNLCEKWFPLVLDRYLCFQFCINLLSFLMHFSLIILC